MICFLAIIKIVVLTTLSVSCVCIPVDVLPILQCSTYDPSSARSIQCPPARTRDFCTQQYGLITPRVVHGFVMLHVDVVGDDTVVFGGMRGSDMYPNVQEPCSAERKHSVFLLNYIHCEFDSLPVVFFANFAFASNHECVDSGRGI